MDGMSQDPQPVFDVAKARSSFARYRVMAFVTGGMLLLLCLEMLLKYVVQVNGVDPVTGVPRPVLGAWIAYVHGWIYVIYAITVFDLWSRMRWSFGRILALIAGGVVPVLSFVMERRAKGWFEARIAEVGARQRQGAAQEEVP
jgi:integral membrane protein